MLILFGRSFSGGLLILLKSRYRQMNSFSPDFATEFLLERIEYSSIRQNLFFRVFNTILKIYETNEEIYYLTHSIQALIMPLLFRNKEFVWICQGVEILGQFRLLDVCINSFLLRLFGFKNLEIRVVNPSLEKFFINKRIDVSRDQFIWIDYPVFHPSIKERNIDLLFFLRSERCKNAELAIKLIKKFDANFNCVVVNMMQLQFGFKTEIQGPVSKENVELLLSDTKWLVYTSRFEGYGLLVKEAMECGAGAIIGPEVLMGYECIDGFARVTSYNEKEWRRKITNCLKG